MREERRSASEELFATERKMKDFLKPYFLEIGLTLGQGAAEDFEEPIEKGSCHPEGAGGYMPSGRDHHVQGRWISWNRKDGFAESGMRTAAGAARSSSRKQEGRRPVRL